MTTQKRSIVFTSFAVLAVLFAARFASLENGHSLAASAVSAAASTSTPIQKAAPVAPPTPTVAHTKKSVAVAPATTSTTAATSTTPLISEGPHITLQTIIPAQQSTSTYALGATTSQTVLALMTTLASSSAFTYTGHEEYGLGYFVDSIGGVANAGGKYWFLYINGASSQLGASSAVVHPGDRVAWRYEHGQ